MSKADERKGEADPKAANITQEKLDELINSKFAKGALSAEAKLLKDLGVESVEQLSGLIKANDAAVKAAKDAEDAKKTDAEKYAAQFEEMNTKLGALLKSNETLTANAAMDKVAMKNGIKDLDYYKFLHGKESTKEGFDETKFVDELKTTKPFLFGDAKDIKIDNSPNNESVPKDMMDKIEAATTMAELHALGD